MVFAALGCGIDTAAKQPGGDAGDTPVDPGPTSYTEAMLTVMTKLTITPGTTPDLPSIATIDITARDGIVPVITDLWLYTIDPAGGAPIPLTGFTSTAARKSPRLMLPATIMGNPSGLTPADDGAQNGLMTNTSRGSMKQGAFVSAITGTVTVTLAAVPTASILVIAAREDKRYVGAAVINPDGTPGTVPDGVAVPQTYTRLSYARDIAQITGLHCGGCHKPNHTFMSRPAGTRDELVSDNVGLALGTRTCQKNNPAGSVALDQCVQAITSAFFLVEPGVPALSSWLARARPDEDGNASVNGIKWWGSSNARFLMDYGDHRMPSTTESNDPAMWTNQPTDFDADPVSYQKVWDWVAQGAAP